MGKEQIKNKILEEIARNPLGVSMKKVSLFGSYLDNSNNNDSDVDILVEFKPTAKVGLFELARLQRSFEGVLKKPVDLVTPEALSRFFRSEVLSQAESIYEGK